MGKRGAGLFDRYRAYHELDRPLLQWIGVVGVIAFPLAYMLREMAAKGGYDDIWWRTAAVLLCLGLALRRWWPARLQPHYILYSWGTVFYCLSFMISYTMLRNGGGTPFVVNMVMCTVLIVLLADWRNSVVMLLLGYALSSVVYVAFEPDPSFPADFVFGAAGSALLVVGGALSQQGQKRVELERMRHVYTGLAGSVAHELRTPLAQVRHALDNIARSASARSPSAPPQAQTADILGNVRLGHEAVARGLQAIELALKQLQPRTVDPERVQTLSATALVRQAVERFAYDEASHRARVQVVDEGDFALRADPAALELVFFNLLKNALYYLPLHPAMTVRITVASQPTPRIVVRDTGPGIPPDFLPRLFEEFQTSGKAEGTGLGLSFCRRVMRALGGEIEGRSEWGRFTEFTLAFPQVAAEAPQTRPVPSAPVLAGRRVLVVDDHPLNRSIARALVGDLGLQVQEAEHAGQALALLREGYLPDAILMDINMPGLDGIGATRQLRALPGDAGRVPVLALTANDSPAVQQRAREAGMQGVLGKPIDPEALLRLLGAVLDGGATPAGTLAPAPRGPAVSTLNTTRLEDFRRLGLLQALLPQALLDLRRHVQALQEGEATASAAVVPEALHSLVGLAGEIGAQALHARARACYAEWLEGRRPEGTAWVTELGALLAATEQALWEHCGVRAAPAAPPG